MIAARLEDVAPDGSSTLVTYGLLNLTHRDGHEHPEAAGARQDHTASSIVLNDIAQAFPAGHRIRLALATSHWPIAWPSPELASLTLSTAGSTLALPVRAALAARRRRCHLSRHRKRPRPNRTTITKLAGRNRTITEDPMTGEVTVTVHRERASYHLPAIDLAFEADAEEHYRVREGEPSATTAETRATWRLSRGDWRIRTETATRVTCTPETFEISASMEAFEGEERVAHRDWIRIIPRLLV